MIRVPRFVTLRFRQALYAYADRAWLVDEVRVRALVYLLLAAREDPRHGGFLFGERVLAALRGFSPRRNDVALREWIRELKEDLPIGHLGVTRYDPPENGTLGTCTRIETLRVPDEIEAAADYDRRHFEREDLFDVVTGTKRHRRHRRQELDEALRDVTLAEDTPEPIQRLVGYLHALPLNAFQSRVDANKHLVREILDDPEQPILQDERRYNALSAALRPLILLPLPLYKTTGRTQRPVPDEQSLLGVPTWMRRVLLRDGYEADMSGAQLALVAALWDVPSVREYLATGVSFWSDATAFLLACFRGHRYRPEDQEELKKALKAFVYGLCFCMAELNLRRFGNPDRLTGREYERWERRVVFLQTTFGVPVHDVGRALLDHPVVAALLDARERRAWEVERRGYLVDCFGRTYTLGEMVDGREVTKRSALAAEAQAAEQFVMLRAVEPFLAEAEAARAEGRQPGASLLLYQSDGFTYRTRKRRDGDLWFQRAEEGLLRGCRELERLLNLPTIHTALELKYDPRRDDPDPRTLDLLR